MFRNNKRCTECTDGTVIKLKSKGLDYPTIIYAEYEVNNVKYQVRESIKLKSTVIKLGFLPIGQRKTPKISIEVGSIIKIAYDPLNPSISYIVGNDGIINS